MVIETLSDIIGTEEARTKYGGRWNEIYRSASPELRGDMKNALLKFCEQYHMGVKTSRAFLAYAMERAMQ